MSCETLGGYPSTRPSLQGDPQECYFPFTYNGIVYTSCIDFSSAKPFMTPADPNELVTIPYLTTWCSLVPSYSILDDTRRMWG
jgi:hypothetical protein